MKEIEFVAPKTVDEAVKLMAAAGDKARALAGGTDLIVQMRVGRRTPDVVVDMKSIPELNELSLDARKGLTVGAATPCYLIYQNQKVAAAYPGLIDSASLIGGIQIQGRASIGGNLCNAAPSGDSIPAIIALGGVCTVAGPGGTREIKAEDFCSGPGRNVLQPGELLVNIKFPAPQAHAGATYQRFIPRNEMDIAVAGVGSSVVLDASGRNFVSARVALASVGPTPIFVQAAGQALAGKPVSDANIEAAAKAAQAAAKPISDMRGTVQQRVHLVGVLTKRTLQEAIKRARGEA